MAAKEWAMEGLEATYEESKLDLRGHDYQLLLSFGSYL